MEAVNIERSMSVDYSVDWVKNNLYFHLDLDIS